MSRGLEVWVMSWGTWGQRTFTLAFELIVDAPKFLANIFVDTTLVGNLGDKLQAVRDQRALCLNGHLHNAIRSSAARDPERKRIKKRIAMFSWIG